ncbi:MAG TPA: hypothetical protein VMH02_04605 [Verrucomicrobiae bacterium]|nr:hypothetical protein [Verrucomicrobiae bacterium]
MAFTGPSTTTQVVNLTPSDPRCTGSPLTCTIAVTLLAGSYTVTIKTYDKAPVSGSIPAGAKLLSTANNVPFTMKGGITNDIGFTLDGVVASLVVSGLPSGTAGTPFASSQAFTVSAKDADGDTIVGAYDNAVTLSDDDASGATSIATSGSDSPPAGQLLSSSDTAKLSYTGLAILPVTITARASGATNGSAQFAPALQPIVVTTSDTLNPSFAGVDLYATTGAGSSGTFTTSEAGWTNAPYSKSLTVTNGSGCGSIGTVLRSGNSFTASVASVPSPGTCTALTLSDGLGQSQAVTLAYTNFGYTGSTQSITVPAGVTLVTVNAAGAQGAAGCDTSCGTSSGPGGDGGTVQATVPVAAGSLDVLTGGQGQQGTSSTAGSGGFNGGAAGGYGAAINVGSGGGGASSVAQGGVLLVLGAGGGGGADNCGTSGQPYGGYGGYPTGEDGGTCPGSGSGSGGGGGTQSGGGPGGDGSVGTTNGSAGTSGNGGVGATCVSSCSGVGSGGGGGGGGYWGGGGGGASDGIAGGGGGGGSSYYITGATNVTTTNGTQAGNGSVIIIW